MTTPYAAEAEVPNAQPAGRLHRKLSSFGVLLLTLSCLSPVLSVYGIGADVIKTAGSGAALLFLAGIGVAVVFGMIYAEIASAYPYAGGDYVGLGYILGPSAAFVSLSMWTLTGGPSIAFAAQTVATYVVEIVPAAVPGPVAFGALAIALGIAMTSVRASAAVTGTFLALEMVAVLAIVVAGFASPARSLGEVVAHPQVLDQSGALIPASLGALALGAVSAAFATMGGNQAIVFGEELRDPHRRMGRVMVLAALIGAFATALPVVAVVLGTPDLRALLSDPAPFSAFAGSLGGRMASHALSAVVALAVFNALIVLLMFYARLFYSLGRDDVFRPRINRMLATVDPRSGAPRAAALAAGAISAACALLESHTLVVFLAGFVPFILTLVSLAVIVGRRRRMTGRAGYWRSPLFPLVPALGLAIATALAVGEFLDPEAGRPSMVVMTAIVAAALLWHGLVLRRRPGGWVPRLPEDESSDSRR
jgi:amino acid transporter